MSGACRPIRRGMTLFELLIAIGLVAMLAVLLVPNYIRQVRESRLPNSADQLRSLIYLTRTHAMLDGQRYRIRFVDMEQYDGDLVYGDTAGNQPIVERQSNNSENYGEYELVTDLWAQGVTLYKGIRCDFVRLGRPVFSDELQDAIEADFEDEEEEFDEPDSLFPELVFEPDGTCDWATFILTNANEEVSFEDISSDEDLDAEFLQVIVDGRTGQAWLQRLLDEQEEELLREYGLKPVLRQDFLSSRRLTEDDVREISEGRTRK